MSGNFLLCSLLVLNGLTTVAQSFTGTYTGNVNGDPTTLDLKQNGNQLTGVYKETGNQFNITGSVSGTQATGSLTLSDTGDKLADFTAQLNEPNLEMEMLLLGITNLNVTFTRVGKTNSTSRVPVPAKPVSKQDLDPALIGQWMNEEVINSGSGEFAASFVTVYYVTLDAQGNFVQYRENAGGGSNWSSGPSRQKEGEGQWYAKGNVLYVKLSGSNNFQALHAYSFHDGNLVFKLPNGKYQIWKRIQ